jgi:hypothetical protein
LKKGVFQEGKLPGFHFFLLGACVKAEAATDLTAAGVLGLLSSFDAVDATDLEVCSLRAIWKLLVDGCRSYLDSKTFMLHIYCANRGGI